MNSLWHKVCYLSELETLMGKYIELGEQQVAVFLLPDGSIHAVENLCPHQTGPLWMGDVVEGRVVCPWHGWEFDLKTGQCAHIPNTKVPVFETKVENGEVLVRVDFTERYK